MNLQPQYAYLAKEPGPKMLLELLSHLGLAEIPGPASNPVIIGWAKEVGAGFYYSNDDTPWCALAMSHCAKVAGKALPPDPLAARNWARFGVGVARPMLGDIVVFPHHVALYVGETKTTWVLLGGNQGDKVSIINWAKAAPVLAFRRPIYNQQPANVRPILLNSAGPVGGKIV
jgi:uncharacterized protein (TIGR02594 family)